MVRSTGRALRGTALALLALGALTAAGSAWWRQETLRALAQGRERLASGDGEGAAAFFASADTAPWRRTEAQAGLAVARALAPSAAPGTVAEPLAPAALAAAMTRLPLRASLEAALGARHPEAVLRLAELPGASHEPLRDLYAAAALVSLGRDAEAAALRDANPAAFANRDLGRRVSELLAAHGAGASLVLRDRRGRLLGTRDAEGLVTPAGAEIGAWLPPPARRQLAVWNGTPSLRLSIDLDVSAVAEAALGRYRGTIVVLDARSGEVLAAVSDARSRRRGAAPAFEQRREPASIMKILTTAAALRAGRDPDKEISRMTCRGSEYYDGKVLWCSYRAGHLLSLDRAMAISCNIAFANLGVSLGRRAILDELRRWGFDDPGLPGAGHVKVATGDARQLADLSIGLEATDITPLHAALLAATVAADGVMPRPTLLAASDGALGMSPEPLPRVAGRRVIPSRFVPVLREAMEAVVDHGGTAAGVAPEGFPVAMKTGTASEWRHGYHVNYVGFGPLPDSDLAFCVRLTFQRSSAGVQYAARGVTRRLLEGLAALHARRRVLPPAA